MDGKKEYFEEIIQRALKKPLLEQRNQKLLKTIRDLRGLVGSIQSEQEWIACFDDIRIMLDSFTEEELSLSFED